MRNRLTFAALAMLTGMGGIAHADIYAAGPSYGGNPTGGLATCRIVNVGTSSVSLSPRQIIANTNVVLGLNNDSCNVVLAPGRNCAFTAPVGGNVALTCRVGVSGLDPQISGTIDVQNPVGTVRVVTPMQNTNN